MKKAGYIKRVVSLFVGVAADILLKVLPSMKAVRFAVAIILTLLYIVCFDVSNFSRKEDILKLLFILFSAVTEGFFCLEWLFLVLFEIFVEKRAKGE